MSLFSLKYCQKSYWHISLGYVQSCCSVLYDGKNKTVPRGCQIRRQEEPVKLASSRSLINFDRKLQLKCPVRCCCPWRRGSEVALCCLGPVQFHGFIPARAVVPYYSRPHQVVFSNVEVMSWGNRWAQLHHYRSRFSRRRNIFMPKLELNHSGAATGSLCHKKTDSESTVLMLPFFPLVVKCCWRSYSSEVHCCIKGCLFHLQPKRAQCTSLPPPQSTFRALSSCTQVYLPTCPSALIASYLSTVRLFLVLLSL